MVLGRCGNLAFYCKIADIRLHVSRCQRFRRLVFQVALKFTAPVRISLKRFPGIVTSRYLCRKVVYYLVPLRGARLLQASPFIETAAASLLNPCLISSFCPLPFQGEIERGRGDFWMVALPDFPLFCFPSSDLFLDCDSKKIDNARADLFLLFGSLSLFPKLLNKHTHMLRPRIRKCIFDAKVKIIPRPLPVILMT